QRPERRDGGRHRRQRAPHDQEDQVGAAQQRPTEVEGGGPATVHQHLPAATRQPVQVLGDRLPHRRHGGRLGRVADAGQQEPPPVWRVEVDQLRVELLPQPAPQRRDRQRGEPALGRQRALQVAGEHVAAGGVALGEQAVPGGGDRKSTRLNSGARAAVGRHQRHHHRPSSGTSSSARRSAAARVATTGPSRSATSTLTTRPPRPTPRTSCTRAGKVRGGPSRSASPVATSSTGAPGRRVSPGSRSAASGTATSCSPGAGTGWSVSWSWTSRLPGTSGTAAYSPTTRSASAAGTGDSPGGTASRTTVRSVAATRRPTGTSAPTARYSPSGSSARNRLAEPSAARTTARTPAAT